MTKEELMHRAIELSKNSVKTGGGPFGAGRFPHVGGKYRKDRVLMR